jgi:hypothetical protein
MHKLCNDTDLEIGKTQYLVWRLGARKVSVQSFNDFCYGSFHDLYENGRITRSKIKINKREQKDQQPLPPEERKHKAMVKNLTMKSRKMMSMQNPVNY